MTGFLCERDLWIYQIPSLDFMPIGFKWGCEDVFTLSGAKFTQKIDEYESGLFLVAHIDKDRDGVLHANTNIMEQHRIVGIDIETNEQVDSEIQRWNWVYEDYTAVYFEHKCELVVLDLPNVCDKFCIIDVEDTFQGPNLTQMIERKFM